MAYAIEWQLAGSSVWTMSPIIFQTKAEAAKEMKRRSKEDLCAKDYLWRVKPLWAKRIR
jgi:hypothetical protein